MVAALHVRFRLGFAPRHTGRSALQLRSSDEGADAAHRDAHIGTPQLDSQEPSDLLYGMLVSALCQAVTWWFGHGCTADPELLYGMLVSALCQAVTWWFGHGCTADPEVLAGWYADLVPRAGTSAARRLAASEL